MQVAAASAGVARVGVRWPPDEGSAPCEGSVYREGTPEGARRRRRGGWHDHSTRLPEDHRRIDRRLVRRLAVRLIQRAVGSIPGGFLDPADHEVRDAVDPAGDAASGDDHPTCKRIDSYEISMQQISQQILPADLPATTVWGTARSAASARGLLIHHAVTHDRGWVEPARPGEMDQRPEGWGTATSCHTSSRWIRRCTGRTRGRGRASRHAADVCVDARPYTGPVPIVTHLHGSPGVGDESDGYAGGSLPAADDIPEGFATEGTWFEFFAGKASSKYGVSWDPGSRRSSTRTTSVRVHALVPRPHARDDQVERLRWTSRLLHHPGGPKEDRPSSTTGRVPRPPGPGAARR